MLCCLPIQANHHSSLSALSPKPLDGHLAGLLFCEGVALFFIWHSRLLCGFYLWSPSLSLDLLGRGI